MDNVCMSGGSMGADQLFGELANEAGHSVHHWSFMMHKSHGRKEDTKVMHAHKLMKADPYLKIANEYLDRNFPTRSEYVNNLLRRNYYQVMSSERIYASCVFDKDMKPMGGTSWALIMGINLAIDEVYVFDWTRDKWFEFERKYFNTNLRYADEWIETTLEHIPKPHGIYAGVGSSALPDNGRAAIKSLYGVE
jgi:hypothetical protein